MDRFIFRQAATAEMPRILEMQREIFGGEQGIPQELIDVFMEMNPLCWCALSKVDGKIYAATAAWEQNGETHWGRFIVTPAARRQHIGTELARFSFEALFSMGVEKIHMEARDTTVKIVCGMGGKIVGEPFKFYVGNVTPVILEKKDFLKA